MRARVPKRSSVKSSNDVVFAILSPILVSPLQLWECVMWVRHNKRCWGLSLYIWESIAFLSSSQPINVRHVSISLKKLRDLICWLPGLLPFRAINIVSTNKFWLLLVTFSFFTSTLLLFFPPPNYPHVFLPPSRIILSNCYTSQILSTSIANTILQYFPKNQRGCAL